MQRTLLALTLVPMLSLCPAAQLVSAEEKVSMDFRGPELQVVLDAVADLTGKRFLYIGGAGSGGFSGPAVGAQQVWFRCPVDVPIDKVYGVFQYIMQLHGYALVDRGDVVEVVPMSKANTKSAKTVTMAELEQVKDQMEYLTLVYVFENVTDGLRVQQQLRTIAPGTADGLMILGVQNMPFLMVSGFAPIVHRIGKICEQLDTPPTPPEVQVIALTHAEATELADILEHLLVPEDQLSATRPGLQVAADARTNSLLLSGREADMARALEIVAALDIPTPPGREPDEDDDEGNQGEDDAEEADD